MVASASVLCEHRCITHNLSRATNRCERRKMRQLGQILLLLALAGCSSSGGLFNREEPAPLTSQAARRSSGSQ